MDTVIYDCHCAEREKEMCNVAFLLMQGATVRITALFTPVACDANGR